MGTKHMIKTPTHFADVLYNEVLQKICLNLHLLDKQFDDFCILVFFPRKRKLVTIKGWWRRFEVLLVPCGFSSDMCVKL